MLRKKKNTQNFVSLRNYFFCVVVDFKINFLKEEIIYAHKKKSNGVHTHTHIQVLVLFLEFFTYYFF